jgi:hypothetical protein
MWGVIEFGHNRLEIDVQAVDRRPFGANIDVADVDRRTLVPDNGSMQHEDEAPDVEVAAEAADEASLTVRDEPSSPPSPIATP